MKLPDLSSAISQTHIALQSNAIKAKPHPPQLAYRVLHRRI